MVFYKETIFLLGMATKQPLLNVAQIKRAVRNWKRNGLGFRVLMSIFRNWGSFRLPSIGGAIQSFPELSAYLEKKIGMVPVYISGLMVGVPLCFRVIEAKSRVACMLTNRRLPSATTAVGAQSEYNQTRRARASAMVLLGGFIDPQEARALYVCYTCPQNTTKAAEESILIGEIAALLGSLYETESEPGVLP